MKMKLSDQRIQSLSPGSKEYVAWDTQLYGYGIRVKPSGYKAFILQIDVQGKSRKATLGRFSVVSEEQARQSYFEALARLGMGEPVEQEKFITPRFDEGVVLAKRDAWARIAGCMREEAGSVVGSVIV